MKIFITFELLITMFFPLIGWLFYILVIVREFDNVNNIFPIVIILMGGVGLYGIVKLYLHLISDKAISEGTQPSKIVYFCNFFGFFPALMAAAFVLQKGGSHLGIIHYLVCVAPFLCVIHFVFLAKFRAR